MASTLHSLGRGIGAWLANGNSDSAPSSLLAGRKLVLHAEWDFIGSCAASGGKTATLAGLAKRCNRRAAER
jgi:16S rRNA C967 or C1407 C5-methylase (RsmB/RsmF family)